MQIIDHRTDPPPPRPKPQKRVPRPPRPPSWRETLITDEEPLLALYLYDGAVIAARKVGRRWAAYFVDPHAIRQELAGTPTSSGLLGRHTLATGMRQGLPFTVTRIPPGRVTVGTRGQADRLWTFITPPLVWAGWDAQYRIYALHPKHLVRGWPTSETIPLYHAPFGNTYPSGRICWGSGRQPGPATPTTMGAGFVTYAEESFFAARASNAPSKEHGPDLVALYTALQGQRRYPCDDLVAQGQPLSYALTGATFDDHH